MNPFLKNIIIAIIFILSPDILWGFAYNENPERGIESISVYEIIQIRPDKERLLRNPLNGWVIYGNPHSMPGFWERYDNINVPDLGRSFRISDYANTLYIRSSWSDLNPEDGVYGWNTNEDLKLLIQGAIDRKMKLAFRIVVDSRDRNYAFSPDFVRLAGAKGYKTRGKWSPFPDDPIFQKYFEKFIKAFAKSFNDPDIVDFVDGFSLGKWGEYHTVIYSTGDNTPRKSVFDWITDLYADNFTKIPVVINYHRWIGTEKDWTNDRDYDADSETLLESAIIKGYSLRHDAFGMTTYYGSWERRLAEKYRYVRPVIMEGGWIIKTHRYWNDLRKYRENHPEDVRRGEFKDAEEAYVNMMDFRYGETESWFEDSSFDLVQKFISDGGYRLYPDKISLPKEIKNNTEIKIYHRWNNLGWGYCPTNIPQWKQKYKVAFALFDDKEQLIHAFIDFNTDLSKWIKGSPTEYEFNIDAKTIEPGNYVWAIGLVNTAAGNKIGLEIAAKGDFLPNGWLKLSKVKF